MNDLHGQGFSGFVLEGLSCRMVDRFEFGQKICQPRWGWNVVLKEEREETPGASLNIDRRGKNRGLHYYVEYSRIGWTPGLVHSSALAPFFEPPSCPPSVRRSLKSLTRMSLDHSFLELSQAASRGRIAAKNRLIGCAEAAVRQTADPRSASRARKSDGAGPLN